MRLESDTGTLAIELARQVIRFGGGPRVYVDANRRSGKRRNSATT